MTTAPIDTNEWDRFAKAVKGIGNQTVAVGVFGDEELATIFATHEYGTDDGTIPERSSLRSTLHDRAPDINRLMRTLASAYLNGKNAGAKKKPTPGTVADARRVLRILGTFAANAVKAKIRSNIPPALKKSTIKRKGSSVALIDTGRMINAVTFKIIP